MGAARDQCKAQGLKCSLEKELQRPRSITNTSTESVTGKENCPEYALWPVTDWAPRRDLNKKLRSIKGIASLPTT